MTDEELAAIEERARHHNTDRSCLSMMLCCNSADDVLPLLAEVSRLRAQEWVCRTCGNSAEPA